MYYKACECFMCYITCVFLAIEIKRPESGWFFSYFYYYFNLHVHCMCYKACVSSLCITSVIVYEYINRNTTYLHFQEYNIYSRPVKQVCLRSLCTRFDLLQNSMIINAVWHVLPSACVSQFMLLNSQWARYVVFACLNNACKCSKWSGILYSVRTITQSYHRLTMATS